MRWSLQLLKPFLNGWNFLRRLRHKAEPEVRAYPAGIIG
jgi:hypothetical protein